MLFLCPEPLGTQLPLANCFFPLGASLDFSLKQAHSSSKIESLRVTVDFLKVPLGLKKPVLKEVAVGPPKRPQPAALERYKARRSDAMDTESQYSGYSYKSGHSRSSRKHRCVCVWE